MIECSNISLFHSLGYKMVKLRSMKLYYYFFFITISLIACNNRPKVVEAVDNAAARAPSGFQPTNSVILSQGGAPSSSAVSGDIHQVTVEEVLPTDRYVYLRVREGKKEYWIATRKRQVEKGKRYFFKGGLLKIGFHSTEYNRTFDTLYLVSTIVPADHPMTMAGTSPNDIPAASAPQKSSTSKTATITPPTSPVRVKGSTAIADIVNHPKQYADTEVQVSGVVTKVNPNIMGRNWIHLNDGTTKNFDLVITSKDFAPQGHVATFKGIVKLDRDFGAGYYYKILIEDARLVSLQH